jgi:hypothetical protein
MENVFYVKWYVGEMLFSKVLLNETFSEAELLGMFVVGNGTITKVFLGDDETTPLNPQKDTWWEPQYINDENGVQETIKVVRHTPKQREVIISYAFLK